MRKVATEFGLGGSGKQRASPSRWLAAFTAAPITVNSSRWEDPLTQDGLSLGSELPIESLKTAPHRKGRHKPLPGPPVAPLGCAALRTWPWAHPRWTCQGGHPRKEPIGQSLEI